MTSEKNEHPPSSDQDNAEPQHTYPSGAQLMVVCAGLVLAALCYALDETILATAIPYITDEFHAVQDVGWYGSSFLLAICACQPIYGRLYSVLKIKWVLLGAIIIFEIGNVVGGTAKSSPAVIVGRSIAGVGCAGMNSGTFIVIAHVAPLRRRPFLISVIGSIYGVAAIVGPIVGGVLTEKVSWRWVFYINLPIGAAAFVLLLIGLREPGLVRQQDRPMTKLTGGYALPSAFLFVVSVVALLLALQTGGTKTSWQSIPVIVELTVFAVGSCAFVSLQLWKPSDGLFLTEVTKQRSVIAACWYSFWAGGCGTTIIYYLPIWLQGVKSLEPDRSGILTVPFLLGFVVFAVLAGTLVSWLGYYVPCMIAGSVLMAAGAGMLSTLKPSSSLASCIGFQILYAAGAGLGNNQPATAVQTVLPEDGIAAGTAMTAFCQTLGAAVLLSVAQHMFLAQVLHSAEGTSPSDVLQTGITNLARKLPLTDFNSAIRHAMLVAVGSAAGTILGSLAMEWRSVKSSNQQPIDSYNGGETCGEH